MYLHQLKRRYLKPGAMLRILRVLSAGVKGQTLPVPAPRNPLLVTGCMVSSRQQAQRTELQSPHLRMAGALGHTFLVMSLIVPANPFTISFRLSIVRRCEIPNTYSTAPPHPNWKQGHPAPRVGGHQGGRHRSSGPILAFCPQ